MCLIFSTEKAQEAKKVPMATKAWANDNVTVFGIGVGNNITLGDVELMVGAEARAFHVDNAEALSGLMKTLFEKICALAPL